MSESKTTKQSAEPAMPEVSQKTGPILEVQGLTKYFDAAKGKKVHAVENVSFTLERGETLGIVGESGCGKSSMGRTILKIHDSTSGKIIFDGVDITKFSNKQMNPYRKRMQMIFQDPYASLNPRMTVGEIIEEPMVIHNMGTPKERKAIVQDLIQTVGLKPDHIRRYPFEFSGGQRQRIGLARALAVEPRLIVCDECTSALDVSVQAQILNLLKEIQCATSVAYLFITHDLSVVGYLADRVAVMYLGHLVEEGSAEEIFAHPAHPYTKALFAAAPRLQGREQAVPRQLSGDVPSPIHPPTGCPFHPRCPHATPQCAAEFPGWRNVGKWHRVRCMG